MVQGILIMPLTMHKPPRFSVVSLSISPIIPPSRFHSLLVSLVNGDWQSPMIYHHARPRSVTRSSLNYYKPLRSRGACPGPGPVGLRLHSGPWPGGHGRKPASTCARFVTRKAPAGPAPAPARVKIFPQHAQFYAAVCTLPVRPAADPERKREDLELDFCHRDQQCRG